MKDKVCLSEIGQQADMCWNSIPSHFPFVHLDDYIIMPNHIHGIIIIKKDKSPRMESTSVETRHASVETRHASVETRHASVETQDLASLQIHSFNRFGPQSRNLASIIRGFKIGVVKCAKHHTSRFAWQSRYYDHVIRTEKTYFRIQQYIQNNPKNWDTDEHYL